MSEKRFTYDKPLVAFSKGGINDNVTGETYEFTMDTVLDLLNEQQATITHLEKVFGKNFAERRLLEQDNLVLRNENEQLRQQVQNAKEIAVRNDMQYQICRKEKEDFQDMCEQLRQQQQRLYNYFRDYLEDEMSAENFGEMWDTVKEDERWNDE